MTPINQESSLEAAHKSSEQDKSRRMRKTQSVNQDPFTPLLLMTTGGTEEDPARPHKDHRNRSTEAAAEKWRSDVGEMQAFPLLHKGKASLPASIQVTCI